LNKADYSKFYHVTNSAKTETLLMSTTVLKLPSQSMTTTAISSTFTPDYAVSGNKLCYASNQSEGLVNILLFSSKLISDKVGLFGLGLSPLLPIGCIICLQILTHISAMIRNFKKIE